jgi:O-antigen/teichoic acid export membrane protein
MVVSQSSFVGAERMGLKSLVSICQSIAKTALSLLLVLLGYGVLGAVVGYTFSILITGIISLMMLYLFVFRNFRVNVKKTGIIKNLRLMLNYGIPLSVTVIVSGLLAQFFGFMMAFFCSDLLIGNYQIALNFVVLLSFVTTPISTVLFPAFAKLNPQNEQDLLKTVFAFSTKYASLLLVPATLAIIVLSQPLIYTIFGTKYIYAPLFLTLYVIGNLFVALGRLSTNSVLISQGETRMLMKQSLLL